MSTMNMSREVLVNVSQNGPLNQAQMAAAAFLARYSGRTLETYRYDLRIFFQWCADVGLPVLDAKRPGEQPVKSEAWRPRRLTGVCRPSPA